MPVKPIQYGKVQVFDRALPDDLYSALYKATHQVGWQFGWNTRENPNHRYWHHEIGRGSKDNETDVTEQVRKHPLGVFAQYMDWLREAVVPAQSRLLRLYLNGHTYGTDGWPHVDTDRPDELTAVLYLCPAWKPEWCGETVVFNAQGDIVASVLPRANRLVTFPSDRLHAPRPLSKAFENLRVVLVAKFGAPPGQGGLFFNGVSVGTGGIEALLGDDTIKFHR